MAARWWSSRGLRRLRSSSARHPLSPELPHETTIPSCHTWCSSPPAGGVRPACLRTSHPFPTSAQNPVPTTPKTLTKPILHSLLPAPVPVPRASLLTPARLNRHNRLPRGGSLQTAVSDAPRSTEPTCTLTVGRIRYSTRVSGKLPMADDLTLRRSASPRQPLPRYQWLKSLGHLLRRAYTEAK